MDVSLPSGCNVFSDSDKFINYADGVATDYFLYNGQVIKGNSVASTVNYYPGFRDNFYLWGSDFQYISWSTYGVTKSFSDGVLTLTTTQSADYDKAVGTRMVSGLGGHKIFITGQVFVSSVAPAKFEVYSSYFNNRPVIKTSNNTLILDEWNDFNFILNLKSTYPTNNNVFMGSLGETTSNVYPSYTSIKNVKTFDLTAIYGAGNEPTNIQRILDDYNFSIGTCFNGTLTYKPETQVYFQALSFALCGLAFFLLFKIFLGRFLK